MAIWVIGDLHLSFGLQGKEMGVFGPEWENHAEKIADFWDTHVTSDDLVLIPGDISWAMTLEEAAADLAWIDKRPGTKAFIRGNHDYWCSAPTKVRKVLPPSVHLVWSDVYQWKDVAVCGTRLWDNPEFNFNGLIDMKKPVKEKPKHEESQEETLRVFRREVMRLESSLKGLNKDARLKIAMVHYPPISADLTPSSVSQLLEQSGVNICVFGHLHSLKPGISPFGTLNGIRYYLSSCDFLNFQLLQIE
jgi:predicted phosphohydrolase